MLTNPPYDPALGHITWSGSPEAVLATTTLTLTHGWQCGQPREAGKGKKWVFISRPPEMIVASQNWHQTPDL